MENAERAVELRILIAGGRSANRSALRLFLQEAGGMEVVGEAADSEELLAEVHDKHPDVVLVEWELPGRSGQDLLLGLRGRDSRSVVIVLSGRPEVEPAVQAAGADAFFDLGEHPKRLLVALQAIQRYIVETRSV